MKTTTLKKLASCVKTALDLNHGLWTGAFKSDATRAVAERALEVQQTKIERCLYVLNRRYLIDLRYADSGTILDVCRQLAY